MKQVTIYFDHRMKCCQVIRPSEKFNGDWKGLVDAVTEGKYYRFVVG